MPNPNCQKNGLITTCRWGGGGADPFHARLRLGAFRANLVYYQRNRFGDYASHGDYHGCLAPPCYLRSVRWRVGRPLEQKTNHDYLRWCHRFGNALVGHIVCYRKIQIWHVYAILFIRSVGAIFQGPAMSASITLMVPREHYTRLAGVSHAVDGIITIVSPPLGALLMSLLPIQAVVAVDIVTAAMAILLLFAVKIPQPPKQKSEKVATSIKTVLTDVKDGFAYVISWRGGILPP